MSTELGKLGVWSWLDAFTAPEAAAFARRARSRSEEA